jgi:hypothetical protein
MTSNHDKLNILVSLNCWEALDCPQEQMESCKAYPDFGKECWKILGTKCSSEHLNTKDLAKKVLYCKNKCDYYRNHISKIFK